MGEIMNQQPSLSPTQVQDPEVKYRQPEGVWRADLVRKIEQAINSVSRENVSNIPDFILAEFAVQAIEAAERAVNARDRWYNVSLSPGKSHFYP